MIPARSGAGVSARTTGAGGGGGATMGFGVEIGAGCSGVTPCTAACGRCGRASCGEVYASSSAGDSTRL